MTYKEESYVLDTLKELQETIRSPEFKQLESQGQAFDFHLSH